MGSISEEMVKIGLQIKAFLENVTGLVPEEQDFRFVSLI